SRADTCLYVGRSCLSGERGESPGHYSNELTDATPPFVARNHCTVDQRERDNRRRTRRRRDQKARDHSFRGLFDPTSGRGRTLLCFEPFGDITGRYWTL